MERGKHSDNNRTPLEYAVDIFKVAGCAFLAIPTTLGLMTLMGATGADAQNQDIKLILDGMDASKIGNKNHRWDATKDKESYHYVPIVNVTRYDKANDDIEMKTIATKSANSLAQSLLGLNHPIPQKMLSDAFALKNGEEMKAHGVNYFTSGVQLDQTLKDNGIIQKMDKLISQATKVYQMYECLKLEITEKAEGLGIGSSLTGDVSKLLGEARSRIQETLMPLLEKLNKTGAELSKMMHDESVVSLVDNMKYASETAGQKNMPFFETQLESLNKLLTGGLDDAESLASVCLKNHIDIDGYKGALESISQFRTALSGVEILPEFAMNIENAEREFVEANTIDAIQSQVIHMAEALENSGQTTINPFAIAMQTKLYKLDEILSGMNKASSNMIATANIMENLFDKIQKTGITEEMQSELNFFEELVVGNAEIQANIGRGELSTGRVTIEEATNKLIYIGQIVGEREENNPKEFLVLEGVQSDLFDMREKIGELGVVSEYTKMFLGDLEKMVNDKSLSAEELQVYTSSLRNTLGNEIPETRQNFGGISDSQMEVSGAITQLAGVAQTLGERQSKNPNEFFGLEEAQAKLYDMIGMLNTIGNISEQTKVFLNDLENMTNDGGVSAEHLQIYISSLTKTIGNDLPKLATKSSVSYTPPTANELKEMIITNEKIGNDVLERVDILKGTLENISVATIEDSIIVRNMTKQFNEIGQNLLNSKSGRVITEEIQMNLGTLEVLMDDVPAHGVNKNMENTLNILKESIDKFVPFAKTMVVDRENYFTV